MDVDGNVLRPVLNGLFLFSKFGTYSITEKVGANFENVSQA